MDNDQTKEFYEALSCNMTAPGQGAMQIVQLYLMPFVYLTVIVLGVPLNVFSLWVFSRRLAQRNRSSLFLHNLAMADISWLLALPFIINFQLSGMEWSLGQLFCRLLRMFYHTYFYLSIFFVTCVSVDRYLAIVHPLRSTTLLTRQRATTLCIILWVVAIAMSIPVAKLNTTLKCQGGNKTVCTMYVLIFTSVQQGLPYSLFCTCLGYLFPLTVLSYCYIRSVCYLRSRVDPRLRGLACEFNAAMVMFGLFYLPYHVSRNLALAMPILAPENPAAWETADLMFCLEVCICSLTSCTNPLFSCFVGRTFRRDVWATFTMLWKKHRVEPAGRKLERSEMGTTEVNGIAN